MNIKVITNISKELNDIEVVINTPELTEEVQAIENDIISRASKSIKKIVGMQGNDIFIINILDIMMIYSEEKNNYCKTKDGIFKIKEKMYYLEEILPKNDFIRIANSKIININSVKCFNTSIIGKIVVKFKDNSEEDVAKRRTSDIMKFLKERSD